MSQNCSIPAGEGYFRSTITTKTSSSVLSVSPDDRLSMCIHAKTVSCLKVKWIAGETQATVVITGYYGTTSLGHKHPRVDLKSKPVNYGMYYIPTARVPGDRRPGCNPCHGKKKLVATWLACNKGRTRVAQSIYAIDTWRVHDICRSTECRVLFFSIQFYMLAGRSTLQLFTALKPMLECETNTAMHLLFTGKPC